jgi:hypothetical protein
MKRPAHRDKRSGHSNTLYETFRAVEPVAAQLAGLNFTNRTPSAHAQRTAARNCAGDMKLPTTKPNCLIFLESYDSIWVSPVGMRSVCMVKTPGGELFRAN